MGSVGYEWSTSKWKDHDHLECLDCAFDSLGVQAVDRMREHCRSNKHGVQTQTPDPDAYVREISNNGGPKSVIITLCYLCWNTRDISVEGVRGLMQEAERLRALGNEPNIIIVDNGSTDGTFAAIMEELQMTDSRHVLVLPLPYNMGISNARNFMIQYATGKNSRYILFLDGDIQIVPLSSYTMMRYLEAHYPVGCIGAYSSNYSDKKEECARSCIEIPESRVKHDIRCAWTQYGLFRMEMFDKGLGFDCAGPFGLPGWGFEDDDLHYQMIEAGYENRYFNGMRYLHRAIHSSWNSLEHDGVDMQTMFTQRKDYLIRKWRGRLDPGILNLLGGQRLPVK